MAYNKALWISEEVWLESRRQKFNDGFRDYDSLLRDRLGMGVVKARVVPTVKREKFEEVKKVVASAGEASAWERRRAEHAATEAAKPFKANFKE